MGFPLLLDGDLGFTSAARAAWYSLLSTPLLVVLIFLISKKEEEELIREFGKEYEDYKEKVPMLIPKAHACTKYVLRHKRGCVYYSNQGKANIKNLRLNAV